MVFTPQSRSQEQQDENYNREEEYLSARRSAVETVMVGRETLETAERQGEQLQNAELLADETEYKLDRAARILKNMTWPGWLSSKFTKDVQPLEYKTGDDEQNLETPQVYESVPDSCYAAAQALQNYHANLQVWEMCETDEQKVTCKLICDNMHKQASKEVTALHLRELEDASDFPARLQRDLNTLRRRQLKSQRESRGLTLTNTTTNSDKSDLFQGAKTEPRAEQSPSFSVGVQQEEHLDFMSEHLEELGSLAGNLNESLQRQSNTLDSLDEKSESTLFKSKMVTRRSDRLIQKQSWSKAKPEFVNNFSIQHIKSGKYLAISANNSLKLSKQRNETCLFGVWKRKGIFGLQSKYSRKWAGQNLLGNLVCSAYSFDRREEWDADDDWSKTHLLSASAGWGNGGFLIVRPEDEVVAIGGGSLEHKKQADLWCIKDHEEVYSKREFIK